MSKKRSGWPGVVLLFVVCAAAYGFLGSYPRVLSVYSDELRYLHIARSLFDGRGLVVRNMASDYQKILYPVCLMPALFFKTTVAQITAIGWINALWMAGAVFPVYALARQTGRSKRGTVFLLAVTALLPTNAAVATFMSETVFLPLSLWMVYFMLRAMSAVGTARRAAWCALCGVWGYLLYLNKEVALYYLIAYFGTRLWWLFYHKKELWGELACWVVLGGSFLGCFAAGKLLLFAGLGNSYNQTGWPDAEQWAYLPFAFVCDLLFFVLAFGVVPVLLAVCGLRAPVAELSPGNSDRRQALRQEQRRQLPLFVLLCLLVGVAAVVYTITVREDLGLASPRQHTRYLEPLLLPLLMAALNTIQEGLPAARRRLPVVLTAVWGAAFLVFCRNIGQGSCDNTFLQWYDFVTDRLDRLPVLRVEYWGVLWRIGVVGLVAALVAATLYILPTGQPVRRRGRAVAGLAAVALVFCLVCNAGEQRINRWSYAESADQITRAAALNDALADLDGTVLFVAEGVRGRDSMLVDTYLDAPLYLAEYTQLCDTGVLDDALLDLTSEQVIPEYPGRPYPDLHRADWLLVSDNIPIDTTNLTPVNVITPEGFTLYRNNTPTVVRFTGSIVVE